MKKRIFSLSLALCLASGWSIGETLQPTLTLQAAIDVALETDPWAAGSRATQSALTDEATAASTLPDPKLTLMAGSIATDSWEFDQEPMSQLSVGIKQMFPRGETRALSREKRLQLAGQQRLLRRDRRAQVRLTVTRLWLDVYKAQESIRLIEKDRSLFQQLVDAARARYASAFGRARQHDVIRAQLELTQLEDRLITLREQQQIAQRRLAEWVGESAHTSRVGAMPAQTPFVPLSRRARYDYISQHPVLLALDKKIAASQTTIDLAREQYKPEWELSARYAYRDDDPLGRHRADLFSFGLSFDLPIFTTNRQDRLVSAAVRHSEATRTEKQLLIRRLLTELDTAAAALARMDERYALYSEQLLPQMVEQAAAALAAYNNDDGDFAEAVRARISELNARIEAVAIATERQKTIADINYLLVEAPLNMSAAQGGLQGDDNDRN